MDGMGCRSAGQPCKLKADESEGSLKETAAVPLLLALPSTNHWTDVGRPTVNLACPASLSSSRLSLDGAVSLCAQAIMKLSVTSHTSHWAVFIRQTHTHSVMSEKHWQLWTQTHVASIHCWESCGWTHILCFPHPLSFSSLPGLWLFAVKVDLINEAHDRHKAPHTFTACFGRSKSEKGKWKRWYLVFVCACACISHFVMENILTFGYWVFRVHVYFSSVIYNSISSVHWCASYLQNTKQSPNPIVLQSN